GTANRIARVVDRTRVLTAALPKLETNSSDYHAYSHQLRHLQTRGQLLVRALRFFYASLGAFATSALMAIGGSILAAYDLHTALSIAAACGFAAGAGGILGLVAGCVLMVRETRVAIRTMTEEIEHARSREGARQPPHEVF